MKTVLLTGSAGFIGWKTAEFLLEKGYKVIGIDNLNNYYDPKLKLWRKSQLEKNKNFKFYEVDISNFGALKVLFDSFDFDYVVNLAARAGVRYSIKNPFVYMQTNATGTLNLLELMKEKGIKKFVLASTSSLYAGQPMPFKETLPVNTPISPYAASKKAAEVMVYTYHYLYGIDVSVVRYFTVFGPAGRPDMSIFRFIKWIDEETPIKLFGDGTQARDFTYVDDIAEGTILAMEKEVGYEIINLGGGKNPISLKTIIEKIENLLGKKAKIEYKPFNKADMKETWADIEKAERLLNWKPKVDVDEGLKRTVEWYLENKEWVKNISLQEEVQNI
ncbi:MAG TPA: NAD-dependent epimerase/dehydratase family protein [Persephonella sp.]|nr:NAD-dependent epimerase/dehydratase family protein [Hydrogenothermaceae bacterium]HIQ25071.1 NAD-dependent epimerase/dehydratase family protein [Persephonella sp.]